MNSPLGDAPSPKVFGPRRRRALLSFRRKSDLVWFVISVGMFFAGLTSLVYTVGQWRRPVVVERVVERVESPDSTVPAVAQKSDKPRSPAEAPMEEPLNETAVAEPAPPVSAAIENAVPSPSPKDKRSKDGKPVRWTLLKEKKFFMILFDKDARLTATPVEAAGDPAVRLEYDFQGGRWVQAFVAINRDFSKFTRVRFSFRGDGANNTVEFKVVDANGTNVGTSWSHRSGKDRWTDVDLPLKDLKYLWGGDGRMDWTQARQVYFAISRKPGDDGGKGRVTIRGVTFS